MRARAPQIIRRINNYLQHFNYRKRCKKIQAGLGSMEVHSRSNAVHTNGIHKGKDQDDSVSKKGGWCSDNAVKSTTYTKGNSLVTPFLVGICPFFAMVMVYTIVKLDGQVGKLVEEVRSNGLLDLATKAWLPYMFGSATAWKFIAPFAIFQLILMRLLPGKTTEGPVTPAGNTPIYKANGLLSFFVTIAAFFIAAYGLKLFNPAEVYDHYLEIIGALNVVSLLFCLFLYVKGRWLPSSSDSGVSGNFLFDYYWGSELYPRIASWDVKQFTNCRFGLMSWLLLPLCFAAKQHEMYGLSNSMVVSVLLQVVYIAKFFHWEMGYMKTLDIMHDRAGFYLCWGCLVWVPSIYTSHTLYLTTHPNDLGVPLALCILLIGLASIYINYNADNQKERVRNTQGQCTIWGRTPDVIRATYQTSKGEKKTSLLLISGWWGVSRHFHYIPEILAAFCWTVPALFGSLLAYFYFVFLVILLAHRSIRDDKRCFEKYGRYWKQYCERVPYKIVPLVF